MLRRGALWLLLLLGAAPAASDPALFCWIDAATELPAACGAPECRVHLRAASALVACLHGGVRLRLAPGAEVCCGRSGVHLLRGTLQVAAPRRLLLRAAASEAFALRGSMRLRVRDGTLQVLLSTGRAEVAGCVQFAGTALESTAQWPMRVVNWPRGLCQESTDIFSWADPVEAVADLRVDECWAAAERWLIAQMLQRGRALPPLQRTAVLMLALERGSPGLQVAALRLLQPCEVAWLSEVLLPLQVSAHEAVQRAALEVLRCGGPFAASNNTHLVHADASAAAACTRWWQGADVAPLTAERRAVLHFVSQPWLYEHAELRGAAEHALDSETVAFDVPRRLHAQIPCDLSTRDPVLRRLEARRQGLLRAAQAQMLCATTTPQLGALHTRSAAMALCAAMGPSVLRELVPLYGVRVPPTQRNPALIELSLAELLHLWVAPGSDVFAP